MAQTLPSDPEPLIRRLYASFNARSIDAVLASLAPDVVWANGMEGGHVVGHDGVRSYWQRQFSQIRSSVTPVAIDPGADGRVRVQVHQVVRSADGEHVLADTTVGHLFTFNLQGLIERFDIE